MFDVAGVVRTHRQSAALLLLAVLLAFVVLRVDDGVVDGWRRSSGARSSATTPLTSVRTPANKTSDSVGKGGIERLPLKPTPALTQNATTTMSTNGDRSPTPVRFDAPSMPRARSPYAGELSDVPPQCVGRFDESTSVFTGVDEMLAPRGGHERSDDVDSFSRARTFARPLRRPNLDLPAGLRFYLVDMPYTLRDAVVLRFMISRAAPPPWKSTENSVADCELAFPIYHALRHHPRRTRDPNRATFFVVPYPTHTLDINGFLETRFDGGAHYALVQFFLKLAAHPVLVRLAADAPAALRAELAGAHATRNRTGDHGHLSEHYPWPRRARSAAGKGGAAAAATVQCNKHRLVITGGGWTFQLHTGSWMSRCDTGGEDHEDPLFLTVDLDHAGVLRAFNVPYASWYLESGVHGAHMVSAALDEEFTRSPAWFHQRNLRDVHRHDRAPSPPPDDALGRASADDDPGASLPFSVPHYRGVPIELDASLEQHAQTFERLIAAGKRLQFTFVAGIVRRQREREGVAHLLTSVARTHNVSAAAWVRPRRRHEASAPEGRNMIPAMMRSRHCVCVSGDTHNSARTYHAVNNLCVPLFLERQGAWRLDNSQNLYSPPTIADALRPSVRMSHRALLPFSGALDWSTFARFFDREMYLGSKATSAQSRDLLLELEQPSRADDVRLMQANLARAREYLTYNTGDLPLPSLRSLTKLCASKIGGVCRRGHPLYANYERVRSAITAAERRCATATNQTKPSYAPTRWADLFVKEMMARLARQEYRNAHGALELDPSPAQRAQQVRMYESDGTSVVFRKPFTRDEIAEIVRYENDN